MSAKAHARPKLLEVRIWEARPRSPRRSDQHPSGPGNHAEIVAVSGRDAPLDRPPLRSGDLERERDRGLEALLDQQRRVLEVGERALREW